MPLARITASLSAIVVVLVPLSCAQLALRLLSDETVVYDGVLKLPAESPFVSVVTALAWTFAIVWALTILSGRYDRPAREALRFLPLALAALLGALATFVAIFFGFGSLAVGIGDAFWIPLLLGLLPLCYVLVRLGLALPVAVLEEMRPPDAFAHAWRLAKGRTIGLSLLLAVGLVLPAFFVGQAIDWLNSSAGILAWTGRQVLITAVAVLQTLVLLEAARIALNRPSTIPSGEYRRGLSFALALAMLIPTAFASLATSNAVIPHVSTRQQNYLFGQVLAAAWPRGHNPVLVTGDSIVDCLDPQCAAINTTALGYQVSPPSDDVTIRSDGAVYTASYLGLEVCGTRRVCTRTSTLIDPIAHAAARAIVLSPCGGTYIATAREVPSAEDPGQTASELALDFCRNVACDQPEVIRLGTVPGSVKAGQGQVLDATIGPDTRPYVTFRPSGGDAWVGWCVPVTCSDPGLARIGDVRVPAIPTFDQLVASHVDRRLLPCHGICGERPYVPEIGRPEGGSYRVEIENSPADRLQIWVGTRPQRGQRAILLVCPESGCDGGSRIALGEDPSYLTSGEWVMAADPAGQRVVLATTSSSPWAILVVSL